MAFDGVAIAALVGELKSKLVGGRIMKVSQPEKDELILTIKNYNQYRLLMSADAGLPLIYLTESNKEAPLQSPAFCMLLRKHLQSAKILDISQPEFERIIYIDLEHLDDMGDLRRKRLIFELMGKHSNIIFCDENGRIIDSIKRVPASVSSVREVLPGREYFITKTVDKLNPLTCTEEEFKEKVLTLPMELEKALYMGLTGISPVVASEILHRAGIPAGTHLDDASSDLATHIYRIFSHFRNDIAEGRFEPGIVYVSDAPKDFSAVKLNVLLQAEDSSWSSFESISSMLEGFYETKNTVTRIRQRSADLHRIVSNAIAREAKKYELQLRQLEDTEKKDKFRIYGELLTTYGYSVEQKSKQVTVNNYYTGEDIIIPLDETLSAIDNAKVYFDKYSKLKRTAEALTKFVAETRADLEHLETIHVALDIARHEEDLIAIRDELAEFGYMKKHFDRSANKSKGKIGSSKNKTGRRVSQPFHYVTEDGFHIYVGKNNYQNDELTFKFASGADWWFHAKQIAGSHVVLRTEGQEVPDRVFEQAAALAAYYSKNRENDKVEVDYLERRNVKKPNGAKPGFVVYYTNYSLVARPGLEGLTLVE